MPLSDVEYGTTTGSYYYGLGSWNQFFKRLARTQKNWSSYLGSKKETNKFEYIISNQFFFKNEPGNT